VGYERRLLPTRLKKKDTPPALRWSCTSRWTVLFWMTYANIEVTIDAMSGPFQREHARQRMKLPDHGRFMFVWIECPAVSTTPRAQCGRSAKDTAERPSRWPTMRIFLRLGPIALICCLLVAKSHAVEAPPRAETTQDASAICSTAILTAQHRYAIPPGLLGSIARVESGRPIASITDIHAWPWTIDADGNGTFFNTKAEAVSWSKDAMQNGVRSLDVGCMQVNLQMHPDAFASLDLAFDPVANADYAARYLRQLRDEANGDWNVAVGLYHSHTPDLAADYRNRVAQVGAGILSGIGAPEPLYLRAMRQRTLRLALSGGGALLLNLGRQPVGRHVLRKSPCEVATIMAPLLHSPPKLAGCRNTRDRKSSR
jgi:hypothetical protein